MAGVTERWTATSPKGATTHDQSTQGKTARMTRLAGGAWLVLVLSWAGCAPAQEPYPFKLESAKEEGGSVIRAHNQGAIPVSLHLRLTQAENVASDVPFPIVVVVPPRTNLRVARIYPVEAGKAWRYRFDSRHRNGSYEARHDPAATYRVPWRDGRTFVIGQAPGGKITTHFPPRDREAVDIPMPEGTPIVAARGGVVFDAVSEHSVGGPDETLMSKANQVRVLHDDGTIGNYVHLMHGGVAVRAGEVVQAGKLLGYSGSTGFSDGPHLHFAITRVVREGESFGELSEPITFYVGNPPYLFAPRTGLVVTANYVSPGQAPRMREALRAR